MSKITDHDQTTVPSSMRKQLNLGKGDQIRDCTKPNGRVYMGPVPAEDGDLALGAFLNFIEADIKARPEHLQVLDAALHDRLKALVGEIDIDLEEPLSAEDE